MKGLIRYGVENPVLVNIVMLAFLLGGAAAGLTLVREMFPESRPNMVMISAVYPGATPLEVENGLALRIEEAVKDVRDIEKISTNIGEGSATVSLEFTSNMDDIDQAVTDVKAEIDAIPRDELPEEAEEIRVQKSEPMLPVIAVALYGDVDEATRKSLGERLRDDLLRLEDVSDIVLAGARKEEITVEVAPEKLIEYGLSLAEVSSAIRLANLDLPGGIVKTSRQNVSIRTLGETDDVARIAETIVRTTPEGRVVRVRDLGEVTDGFIDVDVAGQFNGKPAVNATIYKTGDQDAVDIAARVKAFVAAKTGAPFELSWLDRFRASIGLVSDVQEVYDASARDPYPANVTLITHSNLARFIESRLDLLTRNGALGLALVFLSLLVFLNGRVAFWVMIGLLLSVCGAVVLMQMLGATLNLITMFGLIVVLGLIVDDAIVVGENIYARFEQGEEPHEAAVRGASEVTWPVIIAVLTTIGAFLPLMFIEGRIGDFFGVLPVVVMCALAISVFEAFTLMPCHLAESLQASKRAAARTRPGFLGAPGRAGRWIKETILQGLLIRGYEAFLRRATTYRYVTVASSFALLIIAVGLIAGGRAPFVFIQKMDSETILADMDLPVGTPAQVTRGALSVVEQAALDIDEIKTVWALVGSQIDADETGAFVNQRSHLAQVIMELKPTEQRDISSDEVIAQLRDRTSNIPGVNSLRYRAMQGGPAGREIEIEITGDEMDRILRVAEFLKAKLATFEGTFDIGDDFEEGRPELQIALRDAARPLELTTRSLATEVRGAFYGLEARTIQRGREDIDIRVRFPEERRQHVYELENMRIATPSGAMVPFREVAELEETRGAAAIRRVDQRRAVIVYADVDQAQGNAEQIIAKLDPVVAKLQADNPGIGIEFTGNKRETVKSFGSLRRDFVIALITIYFLLAGLFKSYFQPLVVLTAVPFGIIGAVTGHLLMGYPLTILSMIGLVALTGIVVNDSLILVDFVNKERRGGKSIRDAVIAGARRRLRAILLTSATTILGLAPLMLETSFQARFLIPMAISISFGLAFATVLTLVVVPCNYMILEDLKRLVRTAFTGRADSDEPDRVQPDAIERPQPAG